MGGLVLVKTNRAADQARGAVGGGAASAVEERRNPAGAAAGGSESVVPLAGSGRRWSVRVHWGIVFAIAASVILWLAIKSVVGLAF